MSAAGIQKKPVQNVHSRGSGTAYQAAPSYQAWAYTARKACSLVSTSARTVNGRTLQEESAVTDKGRSGLGSLALVVFGG
jgi:hypothetical protein